MWARMAARVCCQVVQTDACMIGPATQEVYVKEDWPTCMVRMSKRPRKSLTDTSSSNTVRYMSAEVPANMSSLVSDG